MENNFREINDLKRQKKLLKEGLDDLKKINKSKTKENDELKDKISKLKEAKIQRSNIIDKDSSALPKLLQDVRKRDDKARTFAPSDNDEMENLAKLTKAKIKMSDPIDLSLTNRIIAKMEKYKDLEWSEFSKDINKYESINLNDVNNLIDEINSNITERDNIVDLGDNKEIYFRNLTDFLYDIKDGKMSDFNKEREYEKRFMNTEEKLANRKKYSKNRRLYKKYLNNFKKMLFSDRKSSGKGLNISSLPILLSKIYTNNSSKNLINDIEQLINNLYDNEQITKEVYNILNKAITYSQSTNVYDIHKSDS